MKAKLLSTAAAVLCSLQLSSAQTPAKNESEPIFHVTVIQNTITAVNYQYRQGPTKIDFKGTVLMPEAKGEATVESKRGRTEIDARFERLLPPQRFGSEYLTYTLWAVTPEGGVRNIAEVVPGSSDKAALHVSTDLQVFGLIVTAQPYSAARQPSNVVVLENRVRPDTEGKIVEIQAKYELMPRGQYTWQGPVDLGQAAANAPKVSMDQYEAILEIYEGQNAIGIARAAGAEQYAAPTLAKAQQLYEEAQRLQSKKAPGKVVVQTAREAIQTAEDARMIAERKREEETVSKAKTEVADAQQGQARAEEEARRARAEAEAAQNRAERAETESATRGSVPAPAPPRSPAASAAVPTRAAVERPGPDPRKSELRKGLLEKLNAVIPTRDTGPGLVATLPDSAFSGSELHANVSGELQRLAAIVQAQPGLVLNVEGNTDNEAPGGVSYQRAEAVRSAILAAGISDDRVSAHGLGDSHPIGPNTSAAGREANRRVEIVISGDPIGDLASWDRPYALAPGR
jgi:flagellar motor protein MotB